MTILGIESSCDETSAAIVRDGELLATIISSQMVHEKFGGIVPELASRAHLLSVVPIIEQTLSDATIRLTEVDAIAATQGPGLIGSLLIGLHAAKGIAIAYGVPFYPIHHIEAHLFSPFLEEPHPSFPYLGLVVSGGHTQIMRVNAVDDYEILGATIDDAAGEAFDKVGKMLWLGFPGGPEIDKRAAFGNPKAIDFPRPALNKPGYGFSFSGLKTAVLYYLRKHPAVSMVDGRISLPEELLNDICASFQSAMTEVLVTKTLRAAEEHRIRDVAVVGGVSANRELGARMRVEAEKAGRRVFIPKPMYSTDNAAMIAMLAYLKQQSGASPALYSPAFARSNART